MRLTVILAALVVSVSAHAESMFIVDGRQVTQTEAILALLKNPNTEVLKCQPQELKQNKTSLSTKNKSSK